MPDPTYDYLDYDGLALYDEKIKQLIDGKVDKDGAKVLSTNDYTTAEKNKLAGITSGAEPNQNAFSTVVVAGTSLAADTKTDTLTITAGDNVTLTPTAASDSFTIAATDTTYPQATATTGGVLTDAQAVKLNGIATGATKNSATTTTPKMDGTAAVGSETAYAKGDHVHPTDTSRAPLASPALTGTPTAPTATAGTKTTQIATTAFVDTAITNAIAGIQGITYEVVQTLPSTGEAGVIYLVPNSGSGQNIYDEYIWTGTAFEKIGTTDVDLSGYQPLMTAITNAQINALFS